MACLYDLALMAHLAQESGIEGPPKPEKGKVFPRSPIGDLWEEFVSRQPEPRDIWEPIEIYDRGVLLEGRIYLQYHEEARDWRYIVNYDSWSNKWVSVTDLASLGEGIRKAERATGRYLGPR